MTPRRSRFSNTALGATRAAAAGSVPLACLFVGVPLTTFAESGWSHAVGIGCLCAASAFVFVATIEDDQPDARGIASSARLTAIAIW